MWEYYSGEMDKKILFTCFLLLTVAVAFSQSADSCSPITFKKFFRSSNFSDYMQDAVENNNGDVFITGIMRGNAFDAGTDEGLLVKLTKKGDVCWSKKYTNPLINRYEVITATQDDKIACAGSYAGGGIVLTKFDTSGNIVWNKSYKTGLNRLIVKQLSQTQDGDYYLLVNTDNAPSADFAYLLRFNDNGDLLWMKYFRNADAPTSLEGNGFRFLGDTLLLSCNTIAAIQTKTSFFAINRFTGFPYWANLYTVENLATRGVCIEKITADKIVLSGYTSAISGSSLFAFNINRNGEIIEKMRFNSPGLKYAPRLALQRSNELLFADDYSIYSSGINAHCLIKLDSNLSVIWARKDINQFGVSVSLNKIIGAADSSILTIGSRYASNGFNSDLFLNRYDRNGFLYSCPSDTITIAPTQPNVAVVSFTPLVTDQTFLDDIIAYTNENYQTIFLEQPCAEYGTCNFISISGRDTVCNLSDTILFSISKNNLCKANVLWTINPSAANIINQTDSTITVKFLQAGTVNLIATIFTPCKTLKDTLSIHIIISPAFINLGSDFFICPNNTVTLHAGSGYKSYLWSNGSTDSVITVANADNYFVTTTDYCNNIYTDTINVFASQPVNFSLGNDTTRCSNDTLILSAPAGFTNYQWLPNNYISSDTGHTVKVWPPFEMYYSVSAEKSFGCKVFDTVKISVQQTPSVFLGNDAALCKDSVRILNAGAGFTSYMWQDGSNGQTYTVTAPGIYWAEVNNNGCKAKDSVIITAFTKHPFVTIGPDTVLCRNKSVVLKASGNFTDYTWQDGSQNNTYTATAVGMYTLKVIDENGCSARDTVLIKSIAENPQNFVPPSISICEGVGGNIKATGLFMKYLWSTGNTGDSIYVLNSGNYWLEVTNSSGCTSREIVNVINKNCPQAIYFPNSFTPNADGLNDLFKPKIYGGMKAYKLVIFDRYGQKIFETTNQHQAWDGMYKQQPLPAGNYTWYCVYTFATQKETEARGNILLHR